jgi:hypothetical protein
VSEEVDWVAAADVIFLLEFKLGQCRTYQRALLVGEQTGEDLLWGD